MIISFQIANYRVSIKNSISPYLIMPSLRFWQRMEKANNNTLSIRLPFLGAFHFFIKLLTLPKWPCQIFRIHFSLFSGKISTSKKVSTQRCGVRKAPQSYYSFFFRFIHNPLIVSRNNSSRLLIITPKWRLPGL